MPHDREMAKEIARVACLIGDATRSKILVALMGGKALAAGEIALRANISAQTASNHLAKLMRAELITCMVAGRHRYYKISSPLVAHALESLSVLTHVEHKLPPRHEKIDQQLCYARSCYNHIAGKLGVKITTALMTHDYLRLRNSEFELTPGGRDYFSLLGIDCDALLKQRRVFAKPCLDWTEREYHIAGSLGEALLDMLLKQRWLLRSKKPRVLLLTTLGKCAITKLFKRKGI